MPPRPRAAYMAAGWYYTVYIYPAAIVPYLAQWMLLVTMTLMYCVLAV